MGSGEGEEKVMEAWDGLRVSMNTSTTPTKVL
jgi:hypothetical protein